MPNIMDNLFHCIHWMCDGLCNRFNCDNGARDGVYGRFRSALDTRENAFREAADRVEEPICLNWSEKKQSNQQNT